jgi:uncharacterized protein YecE (DUF72 family)
MAIRIGTSGFIYEHWRRRFYPPAARGAELEWFAETFDTVELNVTFYRMPPASTFRSWAARVPAGFVFAVKASRYLTHVKRLKDPREAVDLLVERASELGSHLGPILIQLPPDLELDLPALEETLDAFPANLRVAVEPRHDSWFTEELRRALTVRRVALCVADRRGPITPVWRTADWSYLRFHAGLAQPRSCYGPTELQRWAGRVATTWSHDADGFAYFNNDGNGCALRDASMFGRALAERDVSLTNLPDLGDDVLQDPGRYLPDPEGRAPETPGRTWGAGRLARVTTPSGAGGRPGSPTGRRPRP